MTSYNANTYQYRADGMRTKKVVGSATTTYRYDGQMGMQDVEVNGSTTTVTDYALGARGVDAISKSVNGAAATVSFPPYDAHGNTIGTLARSGSSFTTANERYYDAWGTVNFGGTTGDPKGRYCASIGHKQDDESGLIYMRARYYEPSSGRFVSEDAARDGGNWFSYCGNSPIGSIDPTGRARKSDIKEFERFFQELLRDGRISPEFYNKFLNRSTELRRVIHNAITGRGFSPDEIKDIIEDFYLAELDPPNAGLGLTTLDAAFMADPLFVIGLFEDIGQTLEVFGNQGS